jgi:hypothetical protein
MPRLRHDPGVSDRNQSIDVLRGGLLVLMTMTHLPTIWSGLFGEPLGFISAAEGFVFLSACMAGKIFTQHQQRAGLDAANRWMWLRALRLYAIHMALMLLAFTLIAWIAARYHRPAAANLLDFYLNAPRKAVFSGAMLIYQPALLDILPMYVLFCALTPYVMRGALRWGWSRVMGVSAIVWLAAQFGLRRTLHLLAEQAFGWDIPLNVMGAFDLFAWQFLWVLGLWFGALGFGKSREVLVSSRGVLNIALALSCAIFAWRHYAGPMGFTDMAMHLIWIDKWTLSPVRVVNLAALSCVITGFATQLSKWSRIPTLAALGRASLWVFAAHIASMLVIICLPAQADERFGGFRGVMLVTLGYAVLLAAAAVHDVIRRRRVAQLPH